MIEIKLAHNNPERTGGIAQMSEKIDFKTKIVTIDKEEYYIMIKGIMGSLH